MHCRATAIPPTTPQVRTQGPPQTPKPNNREEREREWGTGERARENGRERVGERPTEQETGANRRKGRVVGLS